MTDHVLVRIGKVQIRNHSSWLPRSCEKKKQEQQMAKRRRVLAKRRELILERSCTVGIPSRPEIDRLMDIVETDRSIDGHIHRRI